MGLTWRRLVTVSGLLAAAAVGAVSLAIGDLEGGVVAMGFTVAAGFTRFRKGTLGAIGLALASAITLYYMLSAAVTNIQAGSTMSSVLSSSGLTAVTLLGLVAGVGFLVRKDSPSTAGPWAGVIAAASVFVGLIVWGSVATGTEPEDGDIHLMTKNVAFSETELVATAGEITVTVENKDLFWHTFTIEELGVDLRVPVGAKLPLTFEAPPGVYEFVCASPGHTEIGMRGTLIVEQ